MEKSKLSWRGIDIPFQFLIRLYRYMNFHHHDLNLLPDIKDFILSHTYTERADSIKTYMTTPYSSPQGDEQTDESFYICWNEVLRPHYKATRTFFGKCATQKHIKEEIAKLIDLGQVYILLIGTPLFLT